MLAKVRARLGKAAKEEKGFTLIELLAVIVILGIIAVIAVPMIGRLINNTGDRANIATARQIYEASRLFIISELNGVVDDQDINIVGAEAVPGATPPQNAVPGLLVDGYLENPLVLPSSKTNIIGGTVNYTDGELEAVAVSIFLEGNNTTTPSITFTREQVLEAE